MQIIVNSVRGKITNCSSSIAEKLYDKCSYRHPEYQFITAYQDNIWDGYIRKFSLKTCSFPSGLLHRITSYLEKNNHKFTIKDERRTFVSDENEVVDNINDFGLILRPYQIRGLIKGIENPYMIYWWATSSGKTIQFAANIMAMRQRGNFKDSLILVANTDLAAQHREELENLLGEKIGLIEEGRFEPKIITVAVINTLFNKAVKHKEKTVLNYLHSVDYLIVDEVHHVIESNMFKRTINQCKNTLSRHGFSGSPYSLTIDDIELECVSGPPLSKITMSYLIRNRYVSRPYITMIKYPFDNIDAPYDTAYRIGIVENVVRNSEAVKIILDEYNNTENAILILVRRILHGKIIYDSLTNEGVEDEDVAYIHGSIPKYKRSEVKVAFSEKKLRIVIASQIWNEGINIPSIDTLVKLDGGGGGDVSGMKGIRAVVQQLGRVLRKPKQKGEDVDTRVEHKVKVYDFCDTSHRDLFKHFQNRVKTYKMEKEYRVKFQGVS